MTGLRSRVYRHNTYHFAIKGSKILEEGGHRIPGAASLLLFQPMLLKLTKPSSKAAKGEPSSSHCLQYTRANRREMGTSDPAENQILADNYQQRPISLYLPINCNPDFGLRTEADKLPKTDSHRTTEGQCQPSSETLAAGHTGCHNCLLTLALGYLVQAVVVQCQYRNTAAMLRGARCILEQSSVPFLFKQREAAQGGKRK